MVIPPPNVTGKLHLGHALTNSVEDAITRYDSSLLKNYVTFMVFTLLECPTVKIRKLETLAAHLIPVSPLFLMWPLSCFLVWCPVCRLSFAFALFVLYAVHILFFISFSLLDSPFF
jgi:hypothetical protein